MVTLRRPSWLNKRIILDNKYIEIQKMLKRKGLHTICEEALCPNIYECFSKKTATFLILGRYCTRNCRFCAVRHGKPKAPDPQEPILVAEAVRDMGLEHVVITSVTRDDLPDGGASHFAKTIGKIREMNPNTTVEVLIPDFRGSTEAISTVLDAGPDIINHNLETVPRLYPRVRPGADYNRSLNLLRQIRSLSPTIHTKSGLMLGLGEREDDVKKVLEDLIDAGCEALTLGQYLQPTKMHIKVERYILPYEFEEWKRYALELGFISVSSGPFVRSSYNAKELLKTLILHTS